MRVEETIYDGEWKAEAIVAWAQLYSQRTIGRADSETIKNYFKGSGIMVQLFVNGSYVNENWYEFQDYLFERVWIGWDIECRWPSRLLKTRSGSATHFRSLRVMESSMLTG